MSNSASSAAAPVTSAARVGELDVLRGFALLGVLTVNISYWLIYPWFATEAQAEALVVTAADANAQFLVRMFGADKANTLFAFLFGVGFWVQMERLEARGANFQRIYMRRLFVLLAFGLCHLLLVWPFDILHLYAIAGFGLLAMRGVSNKVLLIVGLILAFAARPVISTIIDAAGISGPRFAAAFSDEAIQARESASTLVELSGEFTQIGLYTWFGSGLMVAWLFYAFGRFLLGAYVARRGWIQRSAELLPNWRMAALICLPLGMAGQFAATAIDLETWPMLEDWGWAHDWIHYPSVPLIAVGYVATLIVIFHSRLKPLALVFAPVGRMALTNYVMQTFIIGYLAYEAAGGPALAASAGPALLATIALVVFAAQTLFSHIWLAYFAYGPLEWCWRALTYGEAPRMRHEPVPA